MPDEPIALLDGCVLVQAPLRDTLLRLAEPPRLYQPCWSEEIISEMKRTLENRIGGQAGGYRRSSAANLHCADHAKSLKPSWPPMNADKRR